MRVGLVFHQDPRSRPPGIDVGRLTCLAAGLAKRGVQADILAPVDCPATMIDGAGRAIAIRPLSDAQDSRYQLLKTCYHPGIDLVGSFKGPLVCRLVRVVDERCPARDEPRRRRLLQWQQKIQQRAAALAFNNQQNLERWQLLYGLGQPAVLTPTGCPETIPALGPDPYGRAKPAALFLGSLASGRTVEMLNRTAEALRGLAQVHLVGLNKSGLYGTPVRLSGRVIDHGPQHGPRMWDFIGWAAFGIALATGPDAFDNDSSKVYYYLRGGLPVLCEEPILQRSLIADLGMGQSFPLDDLAGMLAGARILLAQGASNRQEAMVRMAGEQSWGNRVETYLQLFTSLLS